MRVITRGEADPEFAVVGSVHGDEPAGLKAIEKILAKDYEYQRPVKFVIANEEALEEDKRFLEADLNRSFPGDRDSDLLEERLASKILEEVRGLKVLDIHTTRSFDEPFATTKSFENPEMEMIKATGAEYAVKFEGSEGNLTDFADGIVVETGLQKTENAVENAVEVIENFFGHFNVIDLDSEVSDPELFFQEEKVEGDWEFLKENFKKVGRGEVYARREGEELVADTEFYPVLMSTNGYSGILGHKASRLEEN